MHEFDVSGKRDPQIEDLLDAFLISGGFEHIQNHQIWIDQWKKESVQIIEKSGFLKEYRRNQYLHTLDDDRAFRYSLTTCATCLRGHSTVFTRMADVLGHSSIETTRIYLISTGTEHARQLERLGLIS